MTLPASHRGALRRAGHVPGFRRYAHPLEDDTPVPRTGAPEPAPM
ncbi:DUF6253 family protein [Streptomyces hyaluromycini]|uniref:DUF6253 family protein n=1 Tax=Streptomyces hyaluromycini TaxID=1377993 RepID=A0ABV1X7Z2_9ACTN